MPIKSFGARTLLAPSMLKAMPTIALRLESFGGQGVGFGHCPSASVGQMHNCRGQLRYCGTSANHASAYLTRRHWLCVLHCSYLAFARKPVWLELQREGLASIRDSLFAPLSVQEARSILQGRQLGVASLRLLPKRIGMRPIVNLGRSSYMSFPAPRAPGAAQRRQRARRIHLSFRPVNFHLQSLHKARAPPECGIAMSHRCQHLMAAACPVYISATAEACGPDVPI